MYYSIVTCTFIKGFFVSYSIFGIIYVGASCFPFHVWSRIVLRYLLIFYKLHTLYETHGTCGQDAMANQVYKNSSPAKEFVTNLRKLVLLVPKIQLSIL